MRPIIFLLILLLFLNYESLSLYQYPQIKNGISGNNLSSDDADSYITLAEKYKNKNPDSALYYAKKAVLTFDNSMNEGQIAEMNILIGHILDKQGNYRVAADYLHSALNIYTTLNNTKKIAEVKNQLGRICADAILIDLSLKHLKDAFALNKSLQNDTIKIQTLYNLGYAYERDNKPQKALFYYKKSEELNNSLQLDEFNFKITEAFASIYEDIGKYDSAMIYYKRVSLMTYSNIYERIDNINNIGDIYRKSGHADSSLLHYTQAYELSVKNHLTRKIEQNARDLALAYEQTGNIKNALFYFKMHINMYKEFYDEQSTAQINQLQIIHESDKLHKEIELHISQTANRTLQRNIVITGFILFLITSLMLWYFLRKQNRVNIRLNSQNDRINRQKEELEEANSELTFLIDQLKNTQDQLVFSEKMATVGTMASGIAHEINNPLNFIQGGIHALDVYIDEKLDIEKNEIEPIIKGIHTGVERASNIVRSLNHFSRKSEAMTEVCNINSIIDNCLTMLQYTAKNRIQIIKRYEQKELLCIGNEGNLHQVILNLIANAAQAIEDKGDIIILTKKSNNKLYITIKDTGIGIQKKYLTKIFDPFFTTKEPGKGTGLGLSISNKIIKEHKGTLQLFSEPNEGTTAEIIIPYFNNEAKDIHKPKNKTT